MSNRARGSRYEQAVLRYLKNKNYQILKTNFRCGRKEIDIICLDRDELVFVEVKGGRSAEFGDPLLRVDDRKQRAIAAAAATAKRWTGGATMIRPGGSVPCVG